MEVSPMTEPSLTVPPSAATTVKKKVVRKKKVKKKAPSASLPGPAVSASVVTVSPRSQNSGSTQETASVADSGVAPAVDAPAGPKNVAPKTPGKKLLRKVKKKSAARRAPKKQEGTEQKKVEERVDKVETDVANPDVVEASNALEVENVEQQAKSGVVLRSDLVPLEMMPAAPVDVQKVEPTKIDTAKGKGEVVLGPKTELKNDALFMSAPKVLVAAPVVVAAAVTSPMPGAPKDVKSFLAKGDEEVIPFLKPSATPGSRMTALVDEHKAEEDTKRSSAQFSLSTKLPELASTPLVQPFLELKISKSSSPDGKKTKEEHALFNVVVMLDNGLKRSSHFFPVSQNEVEDRLRFEISDDNVAVEIKLMGSSCGGDGKPLCMSIFHSVRKLLESKVVPLRAGRHCFELTAAMGPSRGRADAGSVMTNRFILLPASKDPEKPLNEVKTMLAEAHGTAPADLQASGTTQVFLEHNVRRWASLAVDLNRLCDVVVASKYHPAQSMAWRTPSGNHLLHLACLAGHESAVAMLLQWPQLYPISAKNNSGASVLSFAVLSGSRKCVSMILGSRNESEVDALLSGVWTGKRTPLHLAAMMGASEVVEELLKIKRVGLEAFDLVGFTPLLWAAYVGHAETVRVLAEAGASFSATSEENDTALTLAIRRNWEPVVETITKSSRGMFACGNSLSTAVESALWIAMCQSATMAQCVAETMAKAAAVTDKESWATPQLFDVSFKFGEHQNTLLHRAVMVLPDDVCATLIARLAPFLRNEPNAYKQYPVHFALALGKVKSCCALTELKGDVEETDSGGNTLLHYAALTGAAIDWLTKNRACKIEARNAAGLTPLMHSFAMGSPDAISCLIAHGADPSSMCWSGQVAIALLEERKKSSLCLPFAVEDEFVAGSFRIPQPLPSRKSLADVSRRGSVSKKVDKTLVAQIGKAKWM